MEAGLEAGMRLSHRGQLPTTPSSSGPGCAMVALPLLGIISSLSMHRAGELGLSRASRSSSAAG